MMEKGKAVRLKSEFVKKLKQLIPEERVLEKEPMAQHTTFRVGGPAALFVELNAEKEAQAVVALLNEYEEDYCLIGNGSNLLVSDNGFSGVILHFTKEYSHVEIQGEKIICEAGALLSQIGRAALEAGLGGFAFAAGIPGSIGGAMVMNAGAYGGEMKHVVEKVRLLDKTGHIIEKSCEEMHFGYRHSILKEEPYLVLSVTLSLQPCDKDAIREEMDRLARMRREKQPLEYPSAGSTFKRPEGYFAGKLIEDAGLRGYSHGGAQVSEKHCGFVINKEHATAQDIYRLICQVQERVEKAFRVKLEPEVIMLGDFE